MINFHCRFLSHSALTVCLLLTIVDKSMFKNHINAASEELQKAIDDAITIK